MDIPEDPSLQQFISRDEYESMEDTFEKLANTGKAVKRLPKKPFDRQQVIHAFQEAFELIGGVPRLAHWGHNNPGDFYKLYGKLMPSATLQEHAGELQITITSALPRSKLDEIAPSKVAQEKEPVPTPMPAIVKKSQGGSTF